MGRLISQGAGDTSEAKKRGFPAGDNVRGISIWHPGFDSGAERKPVRRGVVIDDDQQVDVAVGSGLTQRGRPKNNDPARLEISNDGIEQFAWDGGDGHDTGTVVVCEGT